MLVLLSALVARVDASPAEDDVDEDEVASWQGGDDSRAADRDVDRGGDGGAGGARADGRRGLWVPITNDMVERVITVAPPIDAVVAAAYRAAGLAGDPTPSWRRRSRLSALVPYVSTRAGQNQSWREIEDPTISRGIGLDLRASWRLDRLLFDPAEPRIASLDIARRRERRRLAAQVIHVYFDWVAARAAADRDLRAVLDLAEQTAKLDALTDGWFSATLAKRAESR